MKPIHVLALLALPSTAGAATLLVVGRISAPRHSSAGAARAEIIYRDGDVISGTISARTIRVADGAFVRVAGATYLHAADALIVGGQLRVDDVALDAVQSHAASLSLESDRLLTITGSVVGGRGKSYSVSDPEAGNGLAGGNGSSIVLVAPDLLVAGFVRSGDGGNGGGGAAGGHGGSISMTGLHTTSHGLSDAALDAMGSQVGLQSGDGGRGGNGTMLHPDGGRGGNSGAITWLPHPDSEIDTPPTGGSTCPKHGDAGKKPKQAVGGNGGDGGDGVPGWANSPAGGKGADGGTGLSIVARDGSPGSKGVDCCTTPPGQGGNGGAGGGGGDARGGNGGKGGKGGPAFVGSNAVGGAGGKGGDAGSATSGNGGKGGDGGKGSPGGSGGAGGAAGSAESGLVGAPGPGGAGDGTGPSGPQGGTGTGGSVIPGTDGGAGNAAGGC